jgi:DNA-binding PadR family transcriptional regulator
MLASGDLQLIVLALLDEKERHGYEIIKALEEHSSGAYVPSPGMIYPALTYLEETGYASSETEGNKKLYRITESGKEHLAKNRKLVDETLEHLSHFGRRMERVRRYFAEEESVNEMAADDAAAGDRASGAKLRLEFFQLREELRTTLREAMNGAVEEKRRALDVLRRAIEELRRKPGGI